MSNKASLFSFIGLNTASLFGPITLFGPIKLNKEALFGPTEPNVLCSAQQSRTCSVRPNPRDGDEAEQTLFGSLELPEFLATAFPSLDISPSTSSSASSSPPTLPPHFAPSSSITNPPTTCQCLRRAPEVPRHRVPLPRPSRPCFQPPLWPHPRRLCCHPVPLPLAQQPALQQLINVSSELSEFLATTFSSLNHLTLAFNLLSGFIPARLLCRPVSLSDFSALQQLANLQLRDNSSRCRRSLVANEEREGKRRRLPGGVCGKEG